MSRVIRIAAAQSGPVSRDASREETLDRLISLMRQAATEQADLVVFTECALTPFFSHWWICLLYTSPSPRDATLSRMPSSA